MTSKSQNLHFFPKIAFLLFSECFLVIDHFNGTAPTDFQISHFNKSREVAQSNRIRIKVINPRTHINMRNKVKKVNN